MSGLPCGEKTSYAFTPLFALNLELKFLPSRPSCLNRADLRQLKSLIHKALQKRSQAVTQVIVRLNSQIEDLRQ